MAGRRGREKDKRRMIDRDKRSRNDEDDWFDDPKRESGSSLRRRETSNQKNTRDDDSLPKWYTERSSKQRDHLPFSHSHLIAAESASVKGISFGKLTLPDSDTRKPNKQEKPSHPLEKVNRVKRRDEIEGARRQRSPLKHGSVVGASRSKSKGNKGNHHEEHERDWEREWRASGGAGGPVIGWGRDMDREERQAKKDAARVSGQRYMGGY